LYHPASPDPETRGAAKVQQRLDEVTDGRTMKIANVGNDPRGVVPPRFERRPDPRLRPQRSEEDRMRRHRERAIAAWLRSLSD